MNDLFRAEALEGVRHKLAGRVILSTPLPTKIISGILILALIVGGGFIGIATYSRKESVSGLLVPTGGMVEVVSAQGGVVTKLHLAQGQAAASGAAIATLRTSSNLAEGGVAEAISNSLSKEGAARAEELAASRQKVRSELSRLSSDELLLSKDIAQAQQRIQTLTEKQSLAQKSLDRAVEVAEKGFLSAQSLQIRKMELLSISEELSLAKSSEIGLRRELNNIAGERRSGASELSREIAAADVAQAALAERSVVARSSGSHIVTMPLSGEVLAVAPRLGSSVQPGGVVAVIAPAKGPLIAELYAPARAAAFLREGQEVRLSYEAFPRERFGTGRGTIESIAKAPLQSIERGAKSDEKAGPTIRIRVRLQNATVKAYGRAEPLTPGMPVSADVIVDRRTLVEWLLDPLYAAGRL